MQNILVSGALGQIGSDLTMALRERYGKNNVVASDIKTDGDKVLVESGPFQIIDCMNIKAIADVVKKNKIDTIYHLAALLSAVAENKPQAAWNLNMTCLYNVLEVARENKCSVFTPSSIGSFGVTTPANDTPQDTIQRPQTMYGVTKVAGELKEEIHLLS